MKFLFCSIFVGIGVISAAAKDNGYEKFAVATAHLLASDAAAAVYEKGGNAVDAAIAAGLTLGVVDSHNSGIEGGYFTIIRTPDGSLLAVDGRETAPAEAHKIKEGWMTRPVKRERYLGCP
jgi:gamma-glutamyltranspeptidase/glutathione hydrolase